MPAANIQINGVASSNDNLPIATLVQLNNVNTGGEVSYLWEILDQPEGTADVLSSSSIQNPTFTPNKEGTYLIRLTVNKTLATEVANTRVAAIRNLKTNERPPAAGEIFEDDATAGWKTSANRLLKRLSDVLGDANLVVCNLPNANVPVLGGIVQFNSDGLIKSGLPGQERLLTVAKALATTFSNVARPLGVVVGTPTGAAPAANGLCIVRRWGLSEQTGSGNPSAGDPVYVGDTGLPSLTPGTIARRIGHVVVNPGGGVYRYCMEGTGQGGTSNVDETLEIAAVAAFTTTGNWAANSAGYVVSSGAGNLYVPIPLRALDRMKSCVFSTFGNGASVISPANLKKIDPMGTVTTISSVTTTPGAAWVDATIAMSPATLAAGECAFLEVIVTGTAVRVGTLRVGYDRPGP